MKHTFMYYMSRFLIITLLLTSFLNTKAQVIINKNTAQTGVIKIKFTPQQTQTLDKLPSSLKTSYQKTGLSSFDVTAKKMKVKKMERLFPYDPNPVNEAKLRKHGLHLWYVVKIDESVNLSTAISDFKKAEEVTTAEASYIKTIAPYQTVAYKPSAKTKGLLPFNDPALKDQWHYNNTGQTGYSGMDINVFKAWEVTAGKTDVIVAINDEGVDVKHEDLIDNMWVNTAELYGTPGVDDDNNGYVDDINGFNFIGNTGKIDAQSHGTHVAGTIAAINNNGKGVSGVAGGTGKGDGVKIMSLQVIGGAVNVEKSFIYAANNGAIISQNSWGYQAPEVYEQSVQDGINYFIAEAGDYTGSPMKGGIVIFAAGNDNDNGKWYPGYFENVLSVSALAPNGKKAGYSNYGDWVDIAAPGGDGDLGVKNNVLSTLPKNAYGYMSGTSMACPHVSGIAALALANRDHKYTNQELWLKLHTSVHDINQYNPNYKDLLGVGYIDAYLAIKNDLKKAPNVINDLKITGMAQEFATIEWSVPVDEDDDSPAYFEVYYSTTPINQTNYTTADKITVINNKMAGETITHQINNLAAITQYYFAVISLDRWGNKSVLSNIVSNTTNTGPAIAVDDNSKAITLNINNKISSFATHPISILNNDAGLLRWEYLIRNVSKTLSSKSFSNKIVYPQVKEIKSIKDLNIQSAAVSENNAPSITPYEAYTTLTKSYTDYASTIIGETDTTIPNSAAIKFNVNEENGFNLTQVNAYLQHNAAYGAIVIEVYKGDLNKKNLVYNQEYKTTTTSQSWKTIVLNEQLFFEKGSTFWIAIHVPAGTLYPLGIGPENSPEYSDYCFMSFDIGKNWTPLEDVLQSNNAVWVINALSNNPDLGAYLTLDPVSGEVLANSSMPATLKADGSKLINGVYKTNLVLQSNDTKNKELRVPVTLNVEGNMPSLKYPDMVEFGSVFLGSSKTVQIVVSNTGYGNLNNITSSIDNTQFSITGTQPTQLKARDQIALDITYTPTQSNVANSTLKLSDGNQTFLIPLFGVGLGNAKITVDPEEQSFDNITIGDKLETSVTVKNEGVYPLKYFIPKFDTSGVSTNWPTDYHSYGYVARTNNAKESNPIPYDYQDISSTGTDITQHYVNQMAGIYKEIDLGFKFPFYSSLQEKIYISQNGFTVFDNTIAAVNDPQIGNTYSPAGYISVLGNHFSYSKKGKIYYKTEKDKFILQYDNVWNGWSNGSEITAQMVLFANGDIRFYYPLMTSIDYIKNNLNILIEDMDKEDPFLFNYPSKTQTNIYSGLVLGLDYPGPDIISSIENGSGTLAAGESKKIKVALDTKNTTEGEVKRYINFINTDPESSTKNAVIKLNIVGGGTPKAILSEESIDFGNVYQGTEPFKQFAIKNYGNGKLNISKVKLTHDKFTVEGNTNTAFTINPGLNEPYIIKVPTTTLGSLADTMEIYYADNTSALVPITANVIDTPKADVDKVLLEDTLEHGATSSHPYQIANIGTSDLQYSISGDQWFRFEETKNTPVTVFDYDVQKHDTDYVYNWIDILETGNKEALNGIFEMDKTKFWHNITLPFPIKFYGKEYSTIKVSENGVICVNGDPEAMPNPIKLPNPDKLGYIMPFALLGGYNTMNYKPEEYGLYYQTFDDKFVVSWEKLVNVFVMGDPVSSQVIFYKDGTMKFQYKKVGVDAMSNTSFIGVQAPDTEQYSVISSNTYLEHGNGLAYTITPSNTKTLATGETLKGNVIFDATNVYAGVYEDVLNIKTNDPNNLLVEKPVKLTVLGQGKLITNAEKNTVDVGTYEYKNEEITYIKKLIITNVGTASTEITNIKLAKGNQALSQTIRTSSEYGGFSYVDISELFKEGSTSKFTLKPGEILDTYVTFTPTSANNFEDELTFTTSVGEIKTIIKGSTFLPPNVDIDKTPIVVHVNNLNSQENRSRILGNTGNSDLSYQASLEFTRKAALTYKATEYIAAQTKTIALNKLQNISSNSLKAMIVPTADEEFTQKLIHTDKPLPDTRVGIGGTETFTVATHFKSGTNGFNISDIGTNYAREDLTDVTILYEIRAGGNSIANAVTVAQGTINQVYKTDDPITDIMLNVKLDQAVPLFPNEDLYVIFTYPIGIGYPQGVISNADKVADRYFLKEGDSWTDLQSIDNFSTSGWYMYAGERTPENIAWVSITENAAGGLKVGDTSQINLLFDSKNAVRGDQEANMVITSNDTYNPVVKVPLLLHVNEAPAFISAPAKIIVAENSAKNVAITIADSENNTINLTTPQSVAGFVNHSFANNTLALNLNPNYGDAGSYNYTFTATDEYGAAADYKVEIEVTKTNRAPKFIGVEKTFTYTQLNHIAEYNITDLFSDPDGDEFTYKVTNQNNQTINIFSNDQTFMLKTMKEGTSKLNFVVTDVNGASTNDVINVIVDDVISGKPVSIYPNPFTTTIRIAVPQGSYSIFNLNGQKLKDSKFNNNTINLHDLEKGVYYISITNDMNETSSHKIIKE